MKKKKRFDKSTIAKRWWENVRARETDSPIKKTRSYRKNNKTTEESKKKSLISFFHVFLAQ